jgi:membrane fusion protein, multidrug efflux system
MTTPDFTPGSFPREDWIDKKLKERPMLHAGKAHFRFTYLGPRAALAGALVILATSCHKEPPAAQQPPEVEVVQVSQQDVPTVHEWVGTADGLVNATIRAQVTGYLIKQSYKEGDLVKKGQVLFVIDPRPFKASLDQAEGSLAQMEALYQNAHANLSRVKLLASQNALSKKDLDDAVASESSTKAQVLSAKAAVENARLNLGFTKITSLISGMAGIARAQVGDLVGPSVQGGELTTVSTINPIKIYYTINEQAYINFMRSFSSESAGLSAAKKLHIELILGDGTRYPYPGKFFAIDRQVDVRTGTLRVAALFPNPTNLLRPGQFVRVQVLLGTRKGALLIPQRSVMELQGSYQVALVGTDNKVELRAVQPGERVGALWEIAAGLKPGERVVAEGLQKVKQGVTVRTRPFDHGHAAPPAGSTKTAGAGR